MQKLTTLKECAEMRLGNCDRCRKKLIEFWDENRDKVYQ